MPDLLCIAIYSTSVWFTSLYLLQSPNRMHSRSWRSESACASRSVLVHFRVLFAQIRFWHDAQYIPTVASCERQSAYICIWHDATWR
ncbi:hypothetical protein BD309DRAFT_952322 [Dichomitus squalens]|nr:hypothetical protein BD309DRAFT_952322 [Dichomitus squalens]